VIPIIILCSSIILLLILILVVKLNAFTALILSTLFVGLCNSMVFSTIIKSISNGIGSTLGSTLLILGFGVLFGSVLSETGAAQRISIGLVNLFGVKRVKIAMALTGFVVGIAMFYNAGFIILIPLVFSVALNTGQPLVYLGIALTSALSVTHGFLPPHPGPSTIAIIFKADIGKTLLYGTLVSIPAISMAGIIFPEFIKKIKANPPKEIFTLKHFEANEMPGFKTSVIVALIPVILMGFATASTLFLPATSSFTKMLQFIGEPGIAMLLALLIAIFVLGIARGIKMKTLMDKSALSLNAVTTILMLIAAGGAFKQILMDSGTGDAVVGFFKDSTLSPLLLGWLIATLIRIAVGSATVAGLTAAGIVQPLIGPMQVNPELMVLSIGAGSLMCSHVNDTGFWMFKEYFGLSVKDTFKTWSIMETIVGIMGLFGVLFLNIFL
jgi:gluconate transporter